MVSRKMGYEQEAVQMKPAAPRRMSGNTNDDFDAAEENIFRAVENVERKVINFAESMVRDEVDILFGKDHGHPIHDDKMKHEAVVKQAPVWHL